METVTSLTASSPSIDGCPVLTLLWRGREFRVPGDADALFSIGLGRDNDLVLPGTYSSRQHATLRWHRNRFELIDHSTNGTFVQLEDEQITHVHRDSIHLWGAGFLSLGEPPSTENALAFSHG